MLNCLNHLGFKITELDQIEKLTLRDYIIGEEAYQIKKAEQRQDMSLQAWNNQTVQAVNNPKSKNPTPKYKHFKDFYDIQQEIDEIRSKYEPDYKSSYVSKKKQSEIFAQRYQEFMDMKKKKKGGN